MQLMVEKCDGGREVYLHTKVLGSIAAALSDSGHYQEDLAEQLAETVTTFLRRRYGHGAVSSDEIHSMIEVALAESDYGQAALALHEHRINRQIKRSRLEVVHCPGFISDELLPYHQTAMSLTSAQPWNKTVIVRELERGRQLSHDMARAVAAAVEEKALRLDCCCITSSLVRELVNNQLFALQRAEHALAEQVSQEEEVNDVVAAAC
jgi:hypothetical protein